ncbi:hypothetical protein L0244_07230 [bacterium]|nr:hypothetical protein [bacterium]
MMKKLLTLLLLIFLTTPAYSIRKPHYGGALRVADSLLQRINEQTLFIAKEDNIVATIPLPFEIQETEARLDFSRVNPELMVEIENTVAAIQDPENACHWILDYPFFDHRHPNQIQMESGTLVIKSTDADYLRSILSSRCLPPVSAEAFRPFNKTQFGLEANTKCTAGRPFLDSITPTPVDPLNPYLSFKLNDVDVLPVPEERFQQINSDPELSIVQGPYFFVYIAASGLKPDEISNLTSAIHIEEIARAVLNDHAEILLSEQNSQPHLNGQHIIEIKIPEEDPYHLMAERFLLDWQEAGFVQGKSEERIEIAAQEMLESDQDLFRYWLLRQHFHINSSKPWFEVWDELEASGQIIPLLVHQTRIAARKNIVNLNVRSGGLLDFANAWMVPEQ